MQPLSRAREIVTSDRVVAARVKDISSGAVADHVGQVHAAPGHGNRIPPSDVSRRAGDHWQTRQNPLTFRNGGCELRCLRMIRLKQPKSFQRFMPLPPTLSCNLVNYPG